MYIRYLYAYDCFVYFSFSVLIMFIHFGLIVCTYEFVIYCYLLNHINL